MYKSVAFGLAAILLASCGGGGGAAGSVGGVTAVVPSPQPTPTNPVGVGNGVVTGSIVVAVPANSGASAARTAGAVSRRPAFIAPTTNGAAWSATGTGGTTGQFSGVADLSSGSSLCSGSGGSRTCDIPFAVPAGSYTFTLDTYDGAPVGGAIPSSAKHLATSTLNATISLNALNNLAFVLSGIVNSVTVTNGVGAATYFSTPGDGTSHTVSMTVVAKDADGNIISGPATYENAIPVSLAESGGSGHMKLEVNGTVVSGGSGSITKPSDTLAVLYDGAGATVDYASVSVGTAAEGGPLAITVSPLFVSPGSISFGKLVTSGSLAIAEPGATSGSGIAYTVTPNSCPSTTSGSVTGSNASATGTVAVNVAGGTSSSCSATVADILGTTVTVPLSFAVPGPITPGTPSGTGVTGTCASTVSFSGSSEVATIVISDPGYSGSLTVGSTNTSVATVNASGMNVTVTSGATPGTATINIADSVGNSYACPIGLTITGGSVSLAPVPQSSEVNT